MASNERRNDPALEYPHVFDVGAQPELPWFAARRYVNYVLTFNSIFDPLYMKGYER